MPPPPVPRVTLSLGAEAKCMDASPAPDNRLVFSLRSMRCASWGGCGESAREVDVFEEEAINFKMVCKWGAGKYVFARGQNDDHELSARSSPR